jgi:hypothetical protein
MTKNKAFVWIVSVGFACLVIGLTLGIYLQEKNENFWQSVILEPDRIEQFEKITEEANELIQRLDALRLEIEEYWMPQSSPDTMRPSRKE